MRTTYADQPNAASTPIETSVSIVVAPWRRFTHVARWKGQAPHPTTGVDRAREAHSHPENCQAGTIASSTTGTASTALTSRRHSSGREPSSSWPASVVGSEAPYPAAPTVASRSSVVTDPVRETCAFSVA